MEAQPPSIRDLLGDLDRQGAAMREAEDCGADAATLDAWLAVLAAAEAALADAGWADLAELVALQVDLRTVRDSPVSFDGLVARRYASRFADWAQLLRARAARTPDSSTGGAGSEAGAAAPDLAAAVHALSACFHAAQFAPPPDTALREAVAQLDTVAAELGARGRDDLAGTLRDLAGDLNVILQSPVTFDGIVAESITDRYDGLVEEIRDLLNVPAAPPTAVEPGADAAAPPAGPAVPEDPEAAIPAIEQASVAVMMLEAGDDPEALDEVFEKVEAVHDALPGDCPADLATLVLSVKAHLATRMHTEDPIAQAELDALQAALRAVQDLLRAAAGGPAVAVDSHALLDALLGLGDGADASTDHVAEPAPDDGVPTLVRIVEEMENPRILRAFIEDVRQQRDTLEDVTLRWEADPSDAELLRAIFRSVHTIKGDAGLIGFPLLNQVFHSLETILSRLREAEIAFRPVHAQLVLDSADLLAHLLTDLEAALELDTVAGWMPHVTDATLRDMLRTIERADTLPAGEQPAPDAAEQPLGQILLRDRAITPAQLDGALRRQQAARQADGPKETLKVNLARLDTLIDLVGELSIAQSMLATQRCALAGVNGQAVEFDKLLDRLGKLTGDIQDRAMAMRMVPVKRAFQKMHRLVRDLGRRADKQVRLETVGEQTEIDKTVVEELGDPLSHLIRNAVDHGLESPAGRAAAGKPPVGRVRLEAYHAAGNIVLEVSDDGRGIDAAQVRAKAEAAGMVEPGAPMSDQQLYHLLLLPGFSLAPAVTEISGRGVGMDVVKKNIEKLRGRIEIESTLGVGTTFRIKLPLTLAIIEGMVVRVGAEQYIIPLLNILQSLRPTREQVQTVQGRGEYVQARGELLPLVRLHALYGVAPQTTAPWEGLLVIVTGENRQAALLVDDLLGQQQVVVKTLGDTFGHLRGISGATIMGDGRVGLIVDVPTLLEHARTRPAAAEVAAPFEVGATS